MKAAVALCPASWVSTWTAAPLLARFDSVDKQDDKEKDIDGLQGGWVRGHGRVDSRFKAVITLLDRRDAGWDFPQHGGAAQSVGQVVQRREGAASLWKGIQLSHWAVAIPTAAWKSESMLLSRGVGGRGLRYPVA